MCFLCGRVGHGSSKCPSSVSNPLLSEAPPADDTLMDPSDEEQSKQKDAASSETQNPPPPALLVPTPPGPLASPEEPFGPWMLVQRRKGRAPGRPIAGDFARLPAPQSTGTCPPDPLHERHVSPDQVFSVPRGRGFRGGVFGRGGRAGRGGRGPIPIFSSSDRCFEFSPAYPEDHPLPLPVANSSPLLSAGPLPENEISNVRNALHGKQPLLDPLPKPRLEHHPESSSLRPRSPLSCSPPVNSPILLSSMNPSSLPQGSLLPPQSSVSSSPPYSDHSLLVAKMVNALCPPQASVSPSDIDGDLSMDEELLSNSSGEFDQDMAVDLQLRDPSLKALARKDFSKPGASRKKGKNSPSS